jgi:hypothetical protein
LGLNKGLNSSERPKSCEGGFFARCFTFHNLEDDIACVAGAAFRKGVTYDRIGAYGNIHWVALPNYVSVFRHVGLGSECDLYRCSIVLRERYYRSRSSEKRYISLVKEPDPIYVNRILSVVSVFVFSNL